MKSFYSGLAYMREESAFEIWSNWVRRADVTLDRRILLDASNHYGIDFVQKFLAVDLERECDPKTIGESRVWEISHLWKRGFSLEQIIARIDWGEARHAEWLRLGKPRDDSYWTVPVPDGPDTQTAPSEEELRSEQEEAPEMLVGRVLRFCESKHPGYNRGVSQLAGDLQVSIEEMRLAVNALVVDSKLEKIQNGHFIAYRLKGTIG